MMKKQTAKRTTVSLQFLLFDLVLQAADFPQQRKDDMYIWGNTWPVKSKK